jgi:hypothetical protein
MRGFFLSRPLSRILRLTGGLGARLAQTMPSSPKEIPPRAAKCSGGDAPVMHSECFRYAVGSNTASSAWLLFALT